jgi:hypothetical protein
VFNYYCYIRKPKGKRLLGIPRCRWVDNIDMDLGEIVWGGVDWISLAQDRDKWRALVNAVMNLQFHKSWESIKWLHNQWPLE